MSKVKHYWGKHVLLGWTYDHGGRVIGLVNGVLQRTIDDHFEETVVHRHYCCPLCTGSLFFVECCLSFFWPLHCRFFLRFTASDFPFGIFKLFLPLRHSFHIRSPLNYRRNSGLSIWFIQQTTLFEGLSLHNGNINMSHVYTQARQEDIANTMKEIWYCKNISIKIVIDHNKYVVPDIFVLI
jgi:hypothetical protein